MSNPKNRDFLRRFSKWSSSKSPSRLAAAASSAPRPDTTTTMGASHVPSNELQSPGPATRGKAGTPTLLAPTTATAAGDAAATVGSSVNVNGPLQLPNSGTQGKIEPPLLPAPTTAGAARDTTATVGGSSIPTDSPELQSSGPQGKIGPPDILEPTIGTVTGVASSTVSSTTLARGPELPDPAMPVKSEPSLWLKPPSATAIGDAATMVGGSVLDDALKKLTDAQREDLGPLLQLSLKAAAPAGITDANVLEVSHTARELQRTVESKGESKGLHFTYGKTTVYLRDQVKKVLRLLESFVTPVGDLLVGVDPIHFGLPWAGFKLLLSFAIANEKQRAAVLTGIELSLYTSNQVELYVASWTKLPPSNASTIFRMALVDLYACVLEFLASGLSLYKRPQLAIIANAIWRPDMLADFERSCTTFSERAQQSANQCVMASNLSWRQELDERLQSLKAIHHMQEALDHIKGTLTNIEGTLDVSQVKVLMDKLEAASAKDATYNSVKPDLSPCLPKTRGKILSEIEAWWLDTNGKTIFWLSGPAGTGKSAISYTVAETLKKAGVLGANFFFKRGRGTRSDAKAFFCSIAGQLAERWPRFQTALAAALDADRGLCTQQPAHQLTDLLLAPLQDALNGSVPLKPMFLVIDALDECDTDDHIKVILSLSSRFETSAIPLRIFLTSRPDVHGFAPKPLCPAMLLEVAQKSSIRCDMEAFYASKMRKIKEDSIVPLPDDWPGKDKTQILLDRTVPLFIAAETVTRYVAEDVPNDRLDRWLKHGGAGSLSGFKKLYMPILEHVVGEDDKEESIDRFRTVVGTIITLKDPLSASSLSRLLPSMSPGQVAGAIHPLASVLSVPRRADGKVNLDAEVTLFHLSFHDFLVDASLNKAELNSDRRFWIDEVQTHSTLATDCIRLLRSGTLKEDVCGEEEPGTKRSAVEARKIRESLPPAVAYACRYWVRHLVEGKGQAVSEKKLVLEFLQEHLLHWMEAMSWLGELSQLILDLESLRSIFTTDPDAPLLRLIDDASRFALRNRTMIDEAPLQTYLSALMFAPSQSIVRQLFGNEPGRHLVVLPEVPTQWGAERMKFEGWEDHIEDVAISGDGRIAAAIISGQGIFLWSTVTGEQALKIKGEFNRMAISGDGKSLVSCARNDRVRLWSTATGGQLLELEPTDPHARSANVVAISADGSVVAASMERAMQLWVVGRRSTPIIVRHQLLRGGKHRGTNVIAMSADGTTVVAGSSLEWFQLWAVRPHSTLIAEQALELEFLHGNTFDVALSADGKTLVTMSRDTEGEMIQVWWIKSNGMGKLISELQANTSYDNIAISADGKAVVFYDGNSKALWMWSWKGDQETLKLGSHEESVDDVAFSADGKTVVSSSGDGTIRVWSMAMAPRHGPTVTRTDSSPSAVCIITSPNGELMASGWSDGKVRVYYTANGKLIPELQPNANTYQYEVHLAISADNQTVVSSYGTKMRVWHGSRVKQPRVFNLDDGDRQEITAVATSADGQTVVAALSDWTVHVWPTAEDKEPHQTQLLGRHRDDVGAVAISADGQTVVSGSRDCTVRVWKDNSMQTFDNEEYIRAVAISPDGKKVASGGYVPKTRLWRTRLWSTEQATQSFCIDAENATSPLLKSLRFTDDGAALRTGAGLIDVEAGTYYGPGSGLHYGPTVHVDYPWVNVNGLDLLWLPREYRGTKAATHGAFLGIAQISGSISIFRFKGL